MFVVVIDRRFVDHLTRFASAYFLIGPLWSMLEISKRLRSKTKQKKWKEKTPLEASDDTLSICFGRTPVVPDNNGNLGQVEK